MKHYLHIYVLAFLITCTAAALYADSAASEHVAGEVEKPQPKRGRPGHSLDISYAGARSDPFALYTAKAVLDDKLFTINDTLPVYNTLRGDIIAPGYAALPSHLYSFSDSIMAQSQEYIAFVMVSSSSDRPFHSRHEISVMGVGGMQIWKNGNNGILAAVYASDTKIFKYNIPLPCVYYTYKDYTLSVLAGIPTLVFWKIHPRLWYSFSFFPFLNIETSLKFRPLPFMSMGPELAFKQEKYSIAGRADPEQKIYRQYASIALTFQSYITMFSGITLSAGYVLYNVYFQGRSVSDRHTPLKAEKEFILKAGAQLFIF